MGTGCKSSLARLLLLTRHWSLCENMRPIKNSANVKFRNIGNVWRESERKRMSNFLRWWRHKCVSIEWKLVRSANSHTKYSTPASALKSKIAEDKMKKKKAKANDGGILHWYTTRAYSFYTLHAKGKQREKRTSITYWITWMLAKIFTSATAGIWNSSSHTYTHTNTSNVFIFICCCPFTEAEAHIKLKYMFATFSRDYDEKWNTKQWGHYWNNVIFVFIVSWHCVCVCESEYCVFTTMW